MKDAYNLIEADLSLRCKSRDSVLQSKSDDSLDLISDSSKTLKKRRLRNYELDSSRLLLKRWLLRLSLNINYKNRHA